MSMQEIAVAKAARRAALASCAVTKRDDGTPVVAGDVIETFRHDGEFATFVEVSRFGRTGTAKILVREHTEESSMCEYNASAFDLRVEHEYDEEWLAANKL